MIEYLCKHNCIFRGGMVRKGARVEAAADDPDPMLRNPHAFAKVREIPDPPAAAPKRKSARRVPDAEAHEREALLQRLGELRGTAPEGATIAQLKALVAAAADPKGQPKLI